VHLELQTGNLARALAFYTRLFGWRPETIRAGGESYLALQWAEGLGGGVLEVETARPLWLPYVEVADVAQATAGGRELDDDAGRAAVPRRIPPGAAPCPRRSWTPTTSPSPSRRSPRTATGAGCTS
jgi:hypothetical protein